MGMQTARNIDRLHLGGRLAIDLDSIIATKLHVCQLVLGSKLPVHRREVGQRKGRRGEHVVQGLEEAQAEV